MVKAVYINYQEDSIVRYFYKIINRKSHWNVLCYLLITLSAQAADNTNYVLGINRSTSGGFYFEQGQLKGVYGEKLQCALNKIDISLNYKVLPVARLELLLQNGEVDVGVGLVTTQERNAYASYSKSLLDVKFLFIQSSQKNILLQHQLSNQKVAVMTESNSVDLAHEFGSEPYQVNSYEQIVQMVAKNRISGAIVPSAVYYSLDKVTQQQLQYYAIKEYAVGFYVSNKSKAHQLLMDSLNKAVSFCLQTKHKTAS